MDEDNYRVTAIITTISMLVLYILCIFAFAQSSNFVTAGAVDRSNINNYSYLSFYTSPFSNFFETKSFTQNESYLKYRFDSLSNYDQITWNRGVDFTKCYTRDSHELDDAIASDTHYVKIRGDTPDEALKTISLPGVMLNAGFYIADPKQLYVSEFRQISPNEYKLWVITKEPVVETIDGALESMCRVSYYY